ncbi:hypothetical protein V8G54_003895 [Vigna mungo]|uniref:Uncharacterized protein n=1 Tax=Vigna mungo TaxID=3915 RepID=A0AAQ3SEB5_VIGMU
MARPSDVRAGLRWRVGRSSSFSLSIFSCADSRHKGGSFFPFLFLVQFWLQGGGCKIGALDATFIWILYGDEGFCISWPGFSFRVFEFSVLTRGSRIEGGGFLFPFCRL